MRKQVMETNLTRLVARIREVGGWTIISQSPKSLKLFTCQACGSKQAIRVRRDSDGLIVEACPSCGGRRKLTPFKAREHQAKPQTNGVPAAAGSQF